MALVATVAYAQGVVQITVGLGGNEFRPPFVDVSANTILMFHFTGGPGNHSISQSSFETPCEPLEGGFSSGFVPVPPGATEVQWNLTVTDDTEAIWFYCAQGAHPPVSDKPHCEVGMVGGINIGKSGKASADFVSNAKAATTFVQPASAVLSGIGATATASPILSLPTTKTSSSAQTGTGGGTTAAASPTNSNSPPANTTGPADTSATNSPPANTTGPADTSATNSATGLIQESGFLVFLASALGVALLRPGVVLN
ncbi:hypothetical protein C8Q74DRAFT_1368183 [Fomes fomentarius]|nr:hypothetical protein C8Q74DRAFT_1368183 [Fomes fomentarius]